LSALQDAWVSLQLWLADSRDAADAGGEALRLLTTLVERRLISASGSFRQLAELLMLRQPQPRAGGLALLAALATAGTHAQNVFQDLQ